MSGRVSAATMGKVAAKLAESGLTLEDAERMHLSYHENAKELHDSFDPVPCIKFPYYTLEDQPMETRAGWGEYWRVRQLLPSAEDVKAEGGFAAQTTGAKVDQKDADGNKVKKKDRRYLQPPETRSGPYFPHTFTDPELDWPSISIDVEVPITLTEGELKAAKMCKENKACIGLGGVWNFKSKQEGYLMLPGLKEIQWARRRVNIIYDSDVVKNANMLQSINEIAEQLYLLGADPWCILLPGDPDNPKRKIGLDDFIVEQGIEALGDLIGSSRDRLILTKRMWELNDRYLHISHTPAHTILDVQTGRIIPEPEKWAKGMSGEKMIRLTMNKDAELIPEESDLAKEWLGWPMHRKYEELEFNPAEDPLSPIDERKFNSWTGWAVEPKKGDLSLLNEWRHHIFGDDMRESKWFMQWHAYPIQNRGVKMPTAVLLAGKQGCGKSTFGEAMARIYGPAHKTVDQHEFFAKFNDWSDRAQYVLADEVFTTFSEHKSEYSTLLKNYVTRKKVSINKKFMSVQEGIKDYANIYMTANPRDALPIETDDRRYFIYRTEAEMISKEFMRKWHAWLDGGGAAALMHYLMHEVDLSDFDPYMEPPMTKSKTEVMEYTQSEGDRIAEEIIINGPKILDKHNPADLFILDHLFGLLPDNEQRSMKTVSGFKRCLIGKGAIKVPAVPHGAENRIKYDGRMVQVHAIRNQAKWATASADEVRAHLTKHDLAREKKEKF